MELEKLSKGKLLKLVGSRLAASLPILFALFFLPAGTWNYWQAWVYIAVLFIPMLFVLIYLLRKDPALLERRMKMKETQTQQKRVILASLFYFLLIFGLPGLDRRFGWSAVPTALVLGADAVILAGYYIFFIVLRENSYASRVVEVTAGQKVISSGPYAVVRHPMYLGVFLMYVFSPLALGSYWAFIPAILILPILAARIRNEESVLKKELEGYAEYQQKTRYRLFPGIW